MTTAVSSPRTLALVAEMTGPTYWRVMAPCNALQAQGVQAWYMANDDPRAFAAAARSEAVILPRLSWSGAARAMGPAFVERNHAFGLAVLGEWDDDVFSEACLPHSLMMGAQYGDDPATVREQRLDRIAALQLCDGVTVSTPRLATVVRQYTEKPVVVVPNALDWPVWQRFLATFPRTEPRLTIGWAGGRRLDADLTALGTAWGQIAARFPDVQFKVAGYHAEALCNAVPAERLILADWEPLATYPRAYAHIDIFCCPLADTPFNRAKSPIKAYEAAAVGAAVVASPTVYGSMLQAGRTGLLATTAEDWTAALTQLVAYPADRQQMAARWAKRVRERYSLAVTLHRWTDAWTLLLGYFHERRVVRPHRRLWVPA